MDDGGAQIPLWGTVLIAGGAALLGAVVGGGMTFLIELWRQVVTGLAASKVIRSELTQNVTAVDYAKRREGLETQLTDLAWRELRTSVAPLVSESVLTYLASDYGFIGQAQAFAHVLYSTGPDATSEQNLEYWRQRLVISGANLLEIEMTSRFKLFWRLIFPPQYKPATLEEAERHAPDDWKS